MRSVKQKRMKDTSRQENNFEIPYHWIEAVKIAKKVLKEFKNRVSLDNFLSWNHYKKFECIVPRKVPIYIIIRHTKYWSAMSLTEPEQSGYIKINIDNDTIAKDIIEYGDQGLDWYSKITESYFYQIVFGTLVHELIHFFQESLGLEEQLASNERKKLVLNGNSFKRDRNNFLYATNWVEMDAELGSYFAQHNFQVPTCKQLISYFRDWYHDDKLASAIGTYIFDYFIGGKKNLEMREEIFKGNQVI